MISALVLARAGGMAKRESAAERLRTFREMAADARRSAGLSTNSEMRRGFEQLAEAWEKLIREIESKG